jgi:hypothetical protein
MPLGGCSELRKANIKMVKVLSNLFNLMSPEFSGAIEESLKELLECKHLYQKSVVAFPSFKVVYKIVLCIPGIEKIQPDLQKECKTIYDSAPEFEWELPSDSVKDRRLPYYEGNVLERVQVSIKFVPRTISIFCSICDSVQPYNFIHGIDVSKNLRSNKFGESSVDVQVFALAYECQSCKSFPEVFMIRREKMKLISSGRTPIEKVEIPKYIPKAQRGFFSDAIIAFNTGQILAGKFLLRTFLEQYVRNFSDENKVSQNIDELFEKYSAHLPDDFKQRFPSLASIYSQLSIDIHSANSTNDLFIQAQNDIQKHFEAKKVFGIS